MDDEHLSRVSGYLSSYGWEYEVDAPNRILTRFADASEDTEFNLIITLSESWIGLTVWPYIFGLRAEQAGAIWRKAGQLNYQIKMARFALTEQNDVALCLDLPIDGLSETLLHRALDTISYYADTYYPVLLEMWQST